MNDVSLGLFFRTFLLGELNESMNAPEFLVEITKAYGSILTHLWWPLVVLVIFFTLLYYFDRSIGSLGRRKRFPLSWKNVNQIVSQLERHYIENMSPNGKNKQREMLVHDQIQRAKRGIEQRNEQDVMKAIVALSTIGVHNDKQLPQQITNEFNEFAEAIEPKNNKQDSSS